MVKAGSNGSIAMGRVADRPFWLLCFSILIRAAHQIGAAIFLASFIFEKLTLPFTYLALTLITGFALVFTEGIRHRQLYREFAGLSTMLKLLLVGAAYHGVLPETLGVSVAFVLASVGAHCPKNIRHRLVF